MITLLTPPALYHRARATEMPIAHAAYRVGQDGRLLHAELPEGLRGGMMVVSGEEYERGGNAAALARAILSECKARGFGSVLCDFEPPVDATLFQTVQWLSQSGRTVLVHEGYARAAREARVLVASAVSGGTLAGRLASAVGRYGKGRVVLAVERVCEDFRMPAPTGQGVPLSRQEREGLLRRYGSDTFFSEELCARYFTYRGRDGGFHFVLFDDGDSIRRKLEVASAHGIQNALLSLPETEDILDEVLEK